MRNATIQMSLPDLERTIPLSLKNFALQAIPDGSISINDTPEGWAVTLAKPNLSAVLVTDRGTIKFYASLDTAIRQLSQIGLSTFLVRTKGAQR